MGHGDLHLGVGGFIQEGKEDDEILVFVDRLRQVRRATLFVVGVGDGELGFGQVFAVRVGIDQGLEIESRLDEFAALYVVHGPVIENLVGLDRRRGWRRFLRLGFGDLGLLAIGGWG